MVRQNFASASVRSLAAQPWSVAAFLLVLLALTRWPLAPRYLYYFDSVNFALALEDFNPALHQPQPPGYPLFVFFTRLIHVFVERPEHVFLVAGILAALAAALLMWQLTSEMFGRAAGVIAVALLVTNPPFWFGGLTNQIRLFLAVTSTGIALLAWRALTRQNPARWLMAAFAAVGLAAGFRLVAPLLLLPLLLWVWWTVSRSWRLLAMCGMLLALASAPWIAVTANESGGLTNWIRLMRNYSVDQFQGTSVAFGAGSHPALQMFWKAVVWNALGGLIWLWAAPFVRLRPVTGSGGVLAIFLALRFLPEFFFSAFIHVADPDQALNTIPALCMIGGAVLAALLRRFGSRRVLLAAGAAAAFNTLLFFVPPGGLAKASSYRAVKATDRMNRSAIDAIARLRGMGPIAIIDYGSLVSWRQLSYYFPNDYLIVLPVNPADSTASSEAWTLHQRRLVTSYPNGSPVLVPRTMRIVGLFAPGNVPKSIEQSGWQREASLVYREAFSGEILKLGAYTVVFE